MRAPFAIGLLVAALCVLTSEARSARAESTKATSGLSLAKGDADRLERGGTVARPMTLEDGEHRVVGGITYTVLDAKLRDIVPLFDDETAYRELLPRTKEAHVRREGKVRHVALRTGNALVEGVYTLFVLQTAPNEFRFWLDPRAPHDIDDAYGYFRFDELEDRPDGRARTMLTYAIAVDIGPGIVRDFFEERVRNASLDLPQALVTRLSRERRGRKAKREPLAVSP